MKKHEDYSHKNLYEHLKCLFPICRSITGEGIRKTLDYFENYHKEFERVKFKTGEKVLDWEIPKEWNIKEAYIEHLETGTRYAEFKKNNLHIVGYSEPKNFEIDYEDLLERIHTHKANDNWVPYVTSYYNKYWGFCMSEREKNTLKKGKYKVVIDSKLCNGFVELSHALLKGESSKEIVFTSYVCHPSMANNELSGPVVLNAILDYIKTNFQKTKYSYRFIMQPETIGSIAYLSKFREELKKEILCGINLSCVGDERSFSYINSPYKNTLADKVLEAATKGLKNLKVYSFLERGSDERQYCTPNINLPFCTFCRSKFGEYAEYHTDADNLDLVTNKGLNESFKVLKTIVDSFEMGLYPKLKTICEPNLGKRNLYPKLNNYTTNPLKLRTNLLAYCNGNNSLFDICKLINCNLEELLNEYKILKESGILDD